MVLDTLRPTTPGDRPPASCLRVQRYNIFRAPPNFGPPIGPILMKNSSKSLTLDRIHASMTLFSLNRDFQHEFDENERAVIHEARIRNFRPSKITSRQ